jgi:hypothetical protein
MQQIRAKNSIVKANTATCHTIIQGNLADTDYSSVTGIGNGTLNVDDVAAVMDIRDQFGVYLAGNGTLGDGVNDERPAGMKNPHLTGGTDIVVHAVGGFASALLFAAEDYEPDILTLAGAVIVAYDTVIDNRFYLMGLTNEALQLGEVYVAQK